MIEAENTLTTLRRFAVCLVLVVQLVIVSITLSETKIKINFFKFAIKSFCKEQSFPFILVFS